MKTSTYILVVIVAPIVYGVSWFAILEITAILDLGLLSAFLYTILESEHLSEAMQIFIVRSLWTIDFAVYLFPAALLTASLILRFHWNAGSVLVGGISIITLVITSPIWLLFLPRFVPFNFSKPYVIFIFPGLLFLSMALIRHITNRSSAFRASRSTGRG